MTSLPINTVRYGSSKFSFRREPAYEYDNHDIILNALPVNTVRYGSSKFSFLANTKIKDDNIDIELNSLPINTIRYGSSGFTLKKNPSTKSNDIDIIINTLPINTVRYGSSQFSFKKESPTGNDSVDIELNCLPVNTVRYGSSKFSFKKEPVITGSWYWISDGINSEYIQIKSVIKNGSVYRVLATANLKNTYNLPATYMYRTTSLVLDGTASGSGDRKGFQWKPTTIWKGVISNVAETQKLETTQDKADDFTVTGDGAFSSDGYFTLQ